MDLLAAMRTFVAIVDHGSMTRAAEVLDRSQPAVVRALAALEAHLGTRLLQRTTRRMSLTPEGSEYLERCRQILSDVQEAERAVGQDETEPHGHIRVTAPVQFGQMHVAPVLARFLKDYPRITVDLVLLDRNADLVDEGIDLAVRIGALPDSTLISLPVGTVHRVVCVSPSLLAEIPEPSVPGDLEDLPCILLQNLGRSGTWTFRDGASAIQVRVKGPMSCNQIAAAISACVEGTGFGQFLSYQVQGHLRAGRLKRVLQRHEEPAIPVNIVYPGGRLVTARQRVLAGFLKTHLAERV